MLVVTDSLKVEVFDYLYCETRDHSQGVFFERGERPELEERVNALITEIAQKAEEVGKLLLQSSNGAGGK